MSVIWHDLECGGYQADLRYWRSLAQAHPGAILDIGAGTGRVTLELARNGHPVTALDLDDELLAELRERAGGLPVQTVVADAREFDLAPRRFSLCVVPMQTIQLLGGSGGRLAFLARAREHLAPGGVIAIAIAGELELFEVGPSGLGPLPDVREFDGVVYSSRPTAVRAASNGFVLERSREVVSLSGRLSAELNLIHLDRVDCDEIEREAIASGLRPIARDRIAPTSDHVGSAVVILGA
jgi:SAM-dependent methyltransferase